MYEVSIACDGCGASYNLSHAMDEEHYTVESCSFCGSDNIDTMSEAVDTALED